MNPDLNLLQPYPFQKTNLLYEGVEPPDKPMITLAIGEPKHETPTFVLDALKNNLAGLSNYPLTKGSPELRLAIADWLSQRFKLTNKILNAEKHVIPVNGTREALFSFTQAVIDRNKENAAILMPNPFYQIYEGAAILAGAKAVYLPCIKETGFNPNFNAVSDECWDNCQILFLCSPGNPTGAVVNKDQIKKLLQLSAKHNFIIASDECYSEIYFDEKNPPVGLLEVAAEVGNTEFKNCMVFHSLSKRSNSPGLRSGFVAGDAQIIEKFLLYRTYHGCAMSPPVQAASIVAWQDEEHVIDNRNQYREKFDAVLKILSPVMNIRRPDASFYLWADVGMNDETFTKEIYRQQNIKVVPGSYLARAVDGINPGKNHIRMALVASLDECVEAATRIVRYIRTV